MAVTSRMEFIARTQLTGTAASVSFATGLSGFTKFFVVAYIVNDANAKSVSLTLNNDAVGANYAYQYLDATGATVSSGRGVTQNITVGTMDASTAALFILEISKPVAAEVARYTIRAATQTTGIVFDAWAREWTNTSAVISRIDVGAVANNFAAGTGCLLYGSRD